MTVPDDLETENQPPLSVPLQHFVVSLVFLVAGGVVGTVAAVEPGSGVEAAHVHLLVVGWVCVTIMGAMTQFVPVWSGTSLHSRLLARLQLVLVGVGVVGLAALFSTGAYSSVVLPGSLVVAGFYVFIYNVGRSLPEIDPRRLDVTEKHFEFALVFFGVVTALGFVVAADFRWGVVSEIGIIRSNLVDAHATLGVFGAVLTTVIGALYQLSTMFTQTEVHGFGERIRSFETVGYPAGVVLLASGRLLGNLNLGRLGTLLILASLAGFGFVLARRLVETEVEFNPMLTRYAVVCVSLFSWLTVTALPLLLEPLGTLFGPRGAHVLLFGVIGFVVIGTVYHVVPFVIWVHRYSDRLGYEPVPMVDDLYSRRAARVDLVLTVVGLAVVVVSAYLSSPLGTAVGGVVSTAGYTVFVLNVLRTVQVHGSVLCFGSE